MNNHQESISINFENEIERRQTEKKKLLDLDLSELSSHSPVGNYDDGYEFIPPTYRRKTCSSCGSLNIRRCKRPFWMRFFSRKSRFVCLGCSDKFYK